MFGISYGERVEGYDIPVINEREARAAAGILLLPAVSSFFISYLTHDFRFTKLFVTFFLLDFLIRVLITPRYAPTFVLARFFVRRQHPEYVGAAQKRFAWSIGLALAIIMFIIIVVLEIMTPVKIAVCLLCIGLLFSESAFGICLGCLLYKRFFTSPTVCPGSACDIDRIKRHSFITLSEIAIIAVTTLTMWGLWYFFDHTTAQTTPHAKCAAGKCAPGKCGSF